MNEKHSRKLIPQAFNIYRMVMTELEQKDSSKTNGVYEEDLYSDEEKYNILRYLTNALESEEAELYKKIK
jgi:hypothetical protein